MDISVPIFELDETTSSQNALRLAGFSCEKPVNRLELVNECVWFMMESVRSVFGATNDVFAAPTCILTLLYRRVKGKIENSLRL
jgi:hypothetical protein